MNAATRYRERLAQLVALPSVSSTQPSCDMSNLQVCERLGEWFEAIGFEVQIQAVPGWPGKYNMVAVKGRGPGGLVLAGHTDTVPFDESRWQQDPFSLTERDGRLHGLGATDMKGFFPAVMAALETLGDTELKQPLIVLGTADEESSMCGARALVDAGHALGRFAVIGEPTGMRPIRMHKGILMESVRVRGRAGHSSNPALGVSAIEAVHAVMAELMALRGEWQQRYHHAGFDIAVPTMNFGCLHGGDNPNRICGECELQYDLRPLPGMDVHALRGEIAARLAPVAEAAGVSLDLQPLFPGIEPFEQAADSELVRVAERLSGYAAASVAYGTEAPFLQALGAQTLVMGPGSIDCAHQPNEFITTEEIPGAVSVLTKLMGELCAKEAEA